MTTEIIWKQRENDNSYWFHLGERTIGNVLPFEDERFAVTDTFEPLREGLVQWTRKFPYRGDRLVRASFRWISLPTTSLSII